MMKEYPLYLKTFESGELKKRINQLKEKIRTCDLCPWRCRADRKEDDKKSVCGGGYYPKVSSYNLHFGEEPPISGYSGSGTIFLTGCQLRCVYCQNYPISQLRYGNEYSFEEFADMMIELQHKGAHNINFVTPTPWIFQILKSLEIAIKKGLEIPLVWNTSGYEDIEALKFLDGIVDIYLTDMKYSDDRYSLKYSKAKSYFSIVKKAVIEMYSQVGDFVMEDGIGKRGLIIRHLVLPENISGFEEILKFLKENVSSNVFISLMSQYFPAYRANEFTELSRKITKEEYDRALYLLEKYGFKNGWIQPEY